jgi:hypothetical protein
MKQQSSLPCSQQPAIIHDLSQINPFDDLPTFFFKIKFNVRGVSKKFGEWSDISTATWARCARMHMAIQR